MNKKPKIKWLDRRIAHPGPFLTLCLSEEELDTAVRAVMNDKLYFPSSGARMHAFKNSKTQQLCCTVSVSEEAQRDCTAIELAGVLVHEAVHVWQEYAAHIGEHKPGDEQEAYAVQTIAQELLAEYARRISK